MILKRLSKAIQNQNWFTVVLEILIVVVGIFLGLQVDDWNESRKFHQEEAVYLEKIHDDLTSMKAQLLERLDGYEFRLSNMTTAIQALEECDKSDSAIASVRYAFETYQTTPPVNYLGATYEEMVASGALARIQDHELKRKIALAFSALGSINSIVRSFRISIPVVDEIMWESVTYGFDPDTGRPSVKFDINEICRNTKVRNALVEMIDIQSDSQTVHVRTLTAADELLGLLANGNAGS